ncbi:MAG: YggS family pyridoxal phosphate-dependent enzyme [Clostridia bacterium]|nr:YggS family pyridoxal phosphate-dependent enzyme [Clostridia bacterium]
MDDGVLSNLREVREEIEGVAREVGRNPAEVQLVAVTKTVAIDKIVPVVQAGVNHLGENRVQELVDKHPHFSGAKWHLIGHLQTNKVKYIKDKVYLIHSLDRWPLAEELNKRAYTGETIDPFNVLIQVNISGEETKYGLEPSQVIDFIKEVAALPGLRIQGLMTMAPYETDPERVRPVFRELRLLAGQIAKEAIPGVTMQHLSMGMSNDFPVAIQEGATFVRVGSRVFGERT